MLSRLAVGVEIPRGLLRVTAVIDLDIHSSAGPYAAFQQVSTPVSFGDRDHFP